MFAEWSKGKRAERFSEIKKEGCKESVSVAAVALTRCLTISVTKPPFS